MTRRPMAHAYEKGASTHRLGDDGWPGTIWDAVTQNDIILYLGRDAFKNTTGYADVATVSGVVRADIGDWITRSADGNLHVAKPDYTTGKTMADLVDGVKPLRKGAR